MQRTYSCLIEQSQIEAPDFHWGMLRPHQTVSLSAFPSPPDSRDQHTEPDPGPCNTACVMCALCSVSPAWRMLFIFHKFY